jgi:hypothetical protein
MLVLLIEGQEVVVGGEDRRDVGENESIEENKHDNDECV